MYIDCWTLLVENLHIHPDICITDKHCKEERCDDQMSICVRGYFGIRWLHITHMVFGHTHMLWILSLFVPIVTQHVPTRVSDSLGTPDWKLPFSKTWLHLMSCDCTVNGLHEMLGYPLVYSMQMKQGCASGLLKWGS